MADAETPMDVERHLQQEPQNVADIAVDGDTACEGAEMQAAQEGDEQEEMPFTDEELAVCFKVPILSCRVVFTKGHALSACCSTH